MESSKKFLESYKDFLNSNSFIAKLSFIILIIIIFILLFNFAFWIMTLIMYPSRSPYIIDGMSDAKKLKIIPQDMHNNGAIPIFRSKDQYNGIELTWSTWIYINDPTVGNGSTDGLSTIFVKGSNGPTIIRNTDIGKFNNSNAPGLYLKTNDSLSSSSTYNTSSTNSVTMNLKIILDIFPFVNALTNKKEYYQEIVIESIPIKKWVSIIIRCSTQNIVDVFINGLLKQRVKLNNTIRQNYDNIYISPNGGFDGFISNLRYFDYSIGTFEINQIVSNGPNLNIEDDTNIKTSNPYYLSTKWLYGEKNV